MERQQPDLPQGTLDMLVLKADKTNKEDIRTRLKRRNQSNAKRMHQTDSNELLEMYLTAITSSFDPHSTYMAPVAAKNFEIVIGLQLEGIELQRKSGQRQLQAVQFHGAWIVPGIHDALHTGSPKPMIEPGHPSFSLS